MNVWIEQDDLAWLWTYFSQGATHGEPWAEPEIIRTVIEAMQQSPEAIAIMCRLRDEYNADADRHAAVKALSDRKDLRCGRATCLSLFGDEQVRTYNLKPGKTCPVCQLGVLRAIS